MATKLSDSYNTNGFAAIVSLAIPKESFVATKDSLGMAKDTMAAKPLVLYESDDLVAMGSEEIAIRSILPQEIDTYDPFDGEVKVWQI